MWWRQGSIMIMTDVIPTHCEACDGVLECPERFLPGALDLCFRNCFCHFHGSHWMLSNLVWCTDLDMERQICAHSCTYVSLQNESIMTFDYSPSGRTVRWSLSPSVVWELIWIVFVTNGTWRVGSRELRIGDWCPLFATYGRWSVGTGNRKWCVESRVSDPIETSESARYRGILE